MMYCSNDYRAHLTGTKFPVLGRGAIYVSHTRKVAEDYYHHYGPMETVHSFDRFRVYV